MIKKIIERWIHDEDAMMERDVDEDLCTHPLADCVDCLECWPDKD